MRLNLSPATLVLAVSLVGNLNLAVARGYWSLYCSDGLTEGCEHLHYYCDQNGRMHGTWNVDCDGACYCVETTTICDDPKHCQ